MEIKGVLETSFLDWDGKIVSTVFLPGCNFRCGFCHNHQLVTSPQSYDTVAERPLVRYWRRNRDFLDGVCITGGEPTLQEDLPRLCRRIKSLGLKVKLDTNGSNPQMLRKLIKEGLLDYIAMDIKAPLGKYPALTAVEGETIDKVRESIHIIISSGVEHEFRTTVIKEKHSQEDIGAIAREVKDAQCFVLQRFVPQEVMEEDYRYCTPYSEEEMGDLEEVARRYVREVRRRGK